MIAVLLRANSWFGFPEKVGLQEEIPVVRWLIGGINNMAEEGEVWQLKLVGDYLVLSERRLEGKKQCRDNLIKFH